MEEIRDKDITRKVQEIVIDAKLQYEKDMAEAWHKEEFELYKESLEKKRQLIEEFASAIEVYDFGIDLANKAGDTNSELDLMNKKFQTLKSQGSALRKEFDEISSATMTSADMAQEQATRVTELGSEMRDTAIQLREVYSEIFNVALTAQTERAESVSDFLTAQIKTINKNIKDIFNEEDSFENHFRNADAYNLNYILPVDDSYKENTIKNNADMVKDTKDTQDKINKIVRDAMDLQHKENAKAREEERKKIQEDYEKQTATIKKELDNLRKANADAWASINEDNQKSIDEMEEARNGINFETPEVDTKKTKRRSIFRDKKCKKKK